MCVTVIQLFLVDFINRGFCLFFHGVVDLPPPPLLHSTIHTIFLQRALEGFGSLSRTTIVAKWTPKAHGHHGPF